MTTLESRHSPLTLNKHGSTTYHIMSAAILSVNLSSLPAASLAAAVNKASLGSFAAPKAQQMLVRLRGLKSDMSFTTAAPMAANKAGSCGAQQHDSVSGGTVQQPKRKQ